MRANETLFAPPRHSYCSDAGSIAGSFVQWRGFMGTHEALDLPVRWITSGGETDYWPVFSPDGAQVLFTRGPERDCTLMVVNAAGGDPAPFLVDAPPELTLQTRADWMLDDPYTVAFAGNGGIWLAGGDGTSPALLPGTRGMIYPAWFPGGDALAVMQTSANGPSTRKIGRSGEGLGPLSPPDLYTGMPTVFRHDPTLLAYPGQPAEGKYDQDVNRIWISDDGGRSARKLDDEQGRQCWWSTTESPVLAFMSTRSGGGAAVYLATPDGTSLVRLTDPAIRAQHPKFSPSNDRIVIAGIPDAPGPTKIGILDLVADERLSKLIRGPRA